VTRQFSNASSSLQINGFKPTPFQLDQVDPTILEFVNHSELVNVRIGHDEKVISGQVDHLDIGVDLRLHEPFRTDFLGQTIHNNNFVLVDKEVEVLTRSETDSTEVFPDFVALGYSD
jgi:hypothetical protein